MKLSKSEDFYRGKYMSVIIQPKEEGKVWLSELSTEEFEKKLMFSAYPLHTEIIYVLKNLEVLTINKRTRVRVEKFVFGTESSKETKIPHYQIYLEFQSLVRSTQLFVDLKEMLGDRVHILTKKVYNEAYQEYCKKRSSNLEYDCKYYWNVKYSSDLDFQLKELKESRESFLNLRKELRVIKENYFTGQKLIKSIALSEADGRSGIWICDLIGGTVVYFFNILKQYN